MYASTIMPIKGRELQLTDLASNNHEEQAPKLHQTTPHNNLNSPNNADEKLQSLILNDNLTRQFSELNDLKTDDDEALSSSDSDPSPHKTSRRADSEDTLTIRLHFIPALPNDNFLDYNNQPSVNVSRNITIAELEQRVHSALNTNVNHWKWVGVTHTLLILIYAYVPYINIQVSLFNILMLRCSVVCISGPINPSWAAFGSNKTSY